MEIVNIIISIIVICFSVFVILHIRPLNSSEKLSLGKKRRKRQIKFYFSFNTKECPVDKELDSRINSFSNNHKINLNLREFPSISSALLKSKKHECVIIGFEKNKKIEFVRFGQDTNRSGLSRTLPFNKIAESAKKENMSSVLVFHNHSESHDTNKNYMEPSDQDLISANDLALTLDRNGVNLIEFMCYKRMYSEYFSSISDSFLPLKGFIEDIHMTNGKSRFKNLTLHIDRLF